MAAGPGNEFELYEELLTPAFEGATGPLSVSFGNAEVSLVAATVAPQTVDGLVSVLPDPMVRAVVFLEGLPQLEDHPFLLAVTLEDAKVAAGLMMDPGAQEPPAEFEDFHQSAVEELLGYVSESVAQDLSARVGRTVSSAVRGADVLTFADEQSALEDLAGDEPLGLVSASYVCADRVIAFSQVISSEFARVITELISPAEAEAPAPAPAPEPEPPAPEPPAPRAPRTGADAAVTQDEIEAILSGMGGGESSAASSPPPRPAAPPAARPAAVPPPAAPRPAAPTPEARPARFEELAGAGVVPPDLDNFPLIADIPIQLSVELGRTHRTIKEILEFGQGYTIRLDKAADEPVDICAGGRTIARGEVVVIDENFAVRIRQIVRPAGSWLHEERGD